MKNKFLSALPIVFGVLGLLMLLGIILAICIVPIYVDVPTNNVAEALDYSDFTWVSAKTISNTTSSVPIDISSYGYNCMYCSLSGSCTNSLVFAINYYYDSAHLDYLRPLYIHYYNNSLRASGSNTNNSYMFGYSIILCTVNQNSCIFVFPSGINDFRWTVIDSNINVYFGTIDLSSGSGGFNPDEYVTIDEYQSLESQYNQTVLDLEDLTDDYNDLLSSYNLLNNNYLDVLKQRNDLQSNLTLKINQLNQMTYNVEMLSSWVNNVFINNDFPATSQYEPEFINLLIEYGIDLDDYSLSDINDYVFSLRSLIFDMRYIFDNYSDLYTLYQDLLLQYSNLENINNTLSNNYTELINNSEFIKVSNVNLSWFEFDPDGLPINTELSNVGDLPYFSSEELDSYTFNGIDGYAIYSVGTDYVGFEFNQDILNITTPFRLVFHDLFLLDSSNNLIGSGLSVSEDYVYDELSSWIDYNGSELSILMTGALMSVIRSSIPAKRIFFSSCEVWVPSGASLDLVIDQAIKQGYSNGFGDGYIDGKNAGYNNARSEYLDGNDFTFLGLMSAIVEAPVTMILGKYDKDSGSRVGGLFNFELLGVNLSGFYLSILTLGIVLFIVKFALGRTSKDE